MYLAVHLAFVQIGMPAGPYRPLAPAALSAKRLSDPLCLASRCSSVLQVAVRHVCTLCTHRIPVAI
jgi:hypothetical protein